MPNGFKFKGCVLLLASSLSACTQTSSDWQKKIETAPPESRKRLDWSSDLIPSDNKNSVSLSQMMSPEGYLRLADKACASGDYKIAAQAATKAVNANPQLAQAYSMRGKARYLMSSGAQGEAIDDLTHAVKLDPHVKEGYEYLGIIYDSQKKYQMAIDAFTNAIKQYPRNSNLFESRASVYSTIGDNERALKDYGQVIKGLPARASSYVMHAKQLERMNRIEEALRDYASAINVQKVPDLATCDSYKIRARLLSKLERHKEAISDLTKSISIDDSDDDALRFRGNEYAALGNYKAAIADYSNAIKLSPDYARASYEARSSAYKALGETALAESDMRQALKLEQKQAEKHVYEAAPR